jgi:hypothetical protein
LVFDVANNTNSKFNDSIEDTFIWTNNKNDTYTIKSGYNCLLSLRDPIKLIILYIPGLRYETSTS